MSQCQPSGGKRSAGVVWGASGVVLLALCGLVAHSLVPLEPRVHLRPPDGLRFLRVAPDCKTAIVAAARHFSEITGPLQVWDTDTGRQRFVLASDWTDEMRVDFSPDSRVVEALDDKKGLKIWNVVTGEEILFLRPTARSGGWVHALYSDDGRFLLLQEYGDDAQQQDSVTFLDTVTGQKLATIPGYFYHLRLTDDGSQLITWQHHKQDKIITVRLWTIDAAASHFSCLSEYSVRADEIAVSPNCRTLACVIGPTALDTLYTIELRDVHSGVVRRQFAHTEDNQNHIQKISFSPDGNLLIIHSAGGSKFDAKAQTALWDVNRLPPQQLAAFLTHLEFSPDGKWFAIPADDGAQLGRAASPAKRTRLHKPGDGPLLRIDPTLTVKVIFSPDSKIIGVTQMRHEEKESAVVAWFSRHIYAIGSNQSGSLARFWDTQTGAEVASMKGVMEAQFSTAGKTLATFHMGSLQLWDIPFRKPLAKILGTAALLWTMFALVIFSVRWRWRHAKKSTSAAIATRNP